MASPPSPSLPPTTTSLSSLNTALRRSALSLPNRLSSIRADADFVSRVADALSPRPLVANQRCGNWYVPPARRAAVAYFKSTDGHERAWKFSTRRLNLHLVQLAENHDGVIIVDSTRRGMPDALSTTVPVWCAVLNQVLLPSHPLSAELFLPPHLLPSAQAQIRALIPSFVASLRALGLALPTGLTKPLRPFWITQDSPVDSFADSGNGALLPDYRPVICCTASRRVVGSELDEAGYIQGAADDAENWACGLDAHLFWLHMDQLMAAPHAELPSLIADLVSAQKTTETVPAPTRMLSAQLAVCSLPPPPVAAPVCLIALTTTRTPPETWIRSQHHMEVGLGEHKPARRKLRLALPAICAFVAVFWHPEASPAGVVVVACPSGKDLAVGTALALSCRFLDDEGQPRGADDGAVVVTKDLVRARLGSFMAAFPEANPSRQTLQSVNGFLMDWRT